MDLVRELRRYQKSRHLVRVRRQGPGRDYTDGFVLGLSDELVVMASVIDFQADGLEIFPLDRVTKIESSARDVFWQTILEREGTVPAGGVPPRLQIGDYRALLGALVKWGRAIGVSYLDEDGETDYYAAGVAREAGETELGLHYFSSSGVWDDELTVIRYDRILRVDVDRPYVNTFERHLVPPDLDGDDAD